MSIGERFSKYPEGQIRKKNETGILMALILMALRSASSKAPS